MYIYSKNFSIKNLPTLCECKQFLKITHDKDDKLIELLLESVINSIHKYSNRELFYSNTTVRLQYDFTANFNAFYSEYNMTCPTTYTSIMNLNTASTTDAINHPNNNYTKLYKNFPLNDCSHNKLHNKFSPSKSHNNYLPSNDFHKINYVKIIKDKTLQNEIFFNKNKQQISKSNSNISQNECKTLQQEHIGTINDENTQDFIELNQDYYEIFMKNSIYCIKLLNLKLQDNEIELTANNLNKISLIQNHYSPTTAVNYSYANNLKNTEQILELEISFFQGLLQYITPDLKHAILIFLNERYYQYDNDKTSLIPQQVENAINQYKHFSLY